MPSKIGSTLQFVKGATDGRISKVKLAIIDTPINTTHEHLINSEIIQKHFHRSYNHAYDHGTDIALIAIETISNNSGHKNAEILSLPVMNIATPIIERNLNLYADIEILNTACGRILSGIGRLRQALTEFSHSDFKVANLSCGILSTTPEVISIIAPVLEKIRLQGYILVVAAGNEDNDLDKTREHDLLLWFQNYEFYAEVDGETRKVKMDNIVVVSAPGRTDISDLNENSVVLCARDNGVEHKIRTGQAAPEIASTLAIMVSRFPSASYDQLIQRILQSADISSNGERHLNIRRALENRIM